MPPTRLPPRRLPPTKGRRRAEAAGRRRPPQTRPLLTPRSKPSAKGRRDKAAAEKAAADKADAGPRLPQRPSKAAKDLAAAKETQENAAKYRQAVTDLFKAETAVKERLRSTSAGAALTATAMQTAFDAAVVNAAPASAGQGQRRWASWQPKSFHTTPPSQPTRPPRMPSTVAETQPFRSGQPTLVDNLTANIVAKRGCDRSR